MKGMLYVHLSTNRKAKIVPVSALSFANIHCKTYYTQVMKNVIVSPVGLRL